jgi:hypothetical protein
MAIFRSSGEERYQTFLIVYELLISLHTIRHGNLLHPHTVYRISHSMYHGKDVRYNGSYKSVTLWQIYYL